MKSMIGVCGAAMMAAAIATPAAAQVAGTYSGTSADGQSLTFVVATDPNTGELAVTSAGIYFSAPCRDSTYILNTGWGFGLAADIKKGTVRISEYDNYYHFAVTLTFASDGQSATGTIASTSPTLYPDSAKPTKALFCTSPEQALSLTLQLDAPATPAPQVNQRNIRAKT